LKGNLSTEGCVAKITGLKNPVITGPARVFDDEPSAMAAILADKINAGDVLVLRYLGPKGAPGMPEMLSPTSALIGKGLGESVGLITEAGSLVVLGAWWSVTCRQRRWLAGRLRWCMKVIPSPSMRTSC
jgi:hypothetical protein